MRGVRVERALGNGQRGRAFFHDLVAPFLHLGVKLLVWHHRIHQPHGKRLGRRIAAAQVPHFARLFLAHDVRQEGCAVARVDRSDLRSHLSEDGLFGCDGQIAECAQDVATTDGIALHAGDHGLGNIADGGVQFFHGKADRPAAIVLAGMGRLVAAGAKGFFARARQNDDTDVVVIARTVECMDQFVAGFPAKCVHPVRTVDRDPGGPVSHFIQDVFVFHAHRRPSLWNGFLDSF